MRVMLNLHCRIIVWDTDQGCGKNMLERKLRHLVGRGNVAVW